MAAETADAESHSETTVLLRVRLQRLAATLESLDQEQLVALNQLVELIEQLTDLLDETEHH